MEKTITKGTKEYVQFVTSLVVLFLGIVLVFVSLFLPPMGIISSSVITVFGMFLGFVGAVWNIDIKYEYKTKELMRDLQREEMRYRNQEEVDEEIDAAIERGRTATITHGNTTIEVKKEDEEDI